jgi:putative membrane protein
MLLAAAGAAAPHTWGHAGWWWIPFTLLFWGAVVAGIAFLVRRVRPFQQKPPSGIDRARDILAERLARGEITPEEYYDRLTALS